VRTEFIQPSLERYVAENPNVLDDLESVAAQRALFAEDEDERSRAYDLLKRAIEARRGPTTDA
jgi:hypothetical protein